MNHPRSQCIAADASIYLHCEGTGGGSITYHWETSNINGGGWGIINDNNRQLLNLNGLEQSQQYRCIVSNEAGSTLSRVATITVLSKYAQ